MSSNITDAGPIPPPSYEQRLATLQNEGYQSIAPGEVCTIERLKDLGLFDAKRYIKDDAGLEDLRTFNVNKDESESRLRTLCKQDLDGTKAYVHCVDQYGPGYKRKPGYPEVCMTYDCPPGFTREGMFCKKEPVLKDARIDKRSHCDERWYDWFTIPNYHLGNKYDNNGKIGDCYTPCPKGHVPAFVTDPVDNSKLTWFGEDHKDKCIPRETYFAGKYAEGTDFCPIAWIHRLGMTSDKIKTKLQAKHDSLRNMAEGYTTASFDKNASDAERAKQAEDIVKDSNTLLTNISKPTSTMEMACGGLNTPERLREAYEICSELSTGEEAMVLDTDPGRDAKKKTMLRQACNAVFCSESNDAINVISRDPICFPNPPSIEPEGAPATATTAATTPEEEENNRKARESQTFFTKAMRAAFYVLMIPAIVLVCYLIYKAMRVIYPRFIRPTIYFILRRFSSKTYASEDYAYEVQKYNEETASKMKKAARREAISRRLQQEAARSAQAAEKIARSTRK